jgi:hypothetical protein
MYTMRKVILFIVNALFVAGQGASLAATATSPQAQSSVVTCAWERPEYPHISTSNSERLGTTDIKTSTTGECTPSINPVAVTAVMHLDALDLGLWSTYVSGTPITKNIQGTSQSWERNELMAVTPCVPGTYRGRLTLSVQSDGDVVVLPDGDLMSSPREIDCKRKNVSMVIDDTGSMSGVIDSVVSSLTSYINSQPEDEYTKWNLTTFKDSPTNVGTTEDRSQILSWVNSLIADGGDDCPEDVLGGISTGLEALGNDSNANRQMLIATDASAHDGDVDGIIASANASGVRVNVLLTGDCGLPSASAAMTISSDFSASSVSSQVVLKRIADETGGKYFYIPGGTTADFTAALNEIFADIANPPTGDAEPPTVQLSVTPSMIYPLNHKMVEIFPTVTATDNIDPDPSVEFVGIEVSGPDNGQGDGDTTDDVQVTPDGHIFVRAERSGNNGERVYTITYRATDAAGNTAYASATVNVLHDQRQ